MEELVMVIRLQIKINKAYNNYNNDKNILKYSIIYSNKFIKFSGQVSVKKIHILLTTKVYDNI